MECDLHCFNRQTKETCPESPCPNNATSFGIHKEIVYNLLLSKRFLDSYFYFQRLLDNLKGRLYCEVDDPMYLDDHEGPNTRKSPGCVVYEKNAELFSLLEYQRELENADSTPSKEQLEKSRKEFMHIMMKNLERLDRIIKAEEYKMVEGERKQQYLERSIIHAEEAIKKGTFMFQPSINLPIEDKIYEQWREVWASKKKEPKPENEPLPKDEERQLYRQEGAENLERIKEQFGENKEKIKRNITSG